MPLCGIGGRPRAMRQTTQKAKWWWWLPRREAPGPLLWLVRWRRSCGSRAMPPCCWPPGLGFGPHRVPHGVKSRYSIPDAMQNADRLDFHLLGEHCHGVCGSACAAVAGPRACRRHGPRRCIEGDQGSDSFFLRRADLKWRTGCRLGRSGIFVR